MGRIWNRVSGDGDRPAHGWEQALGDAEDEEVGAGPFLAAAFRRSIQCERFQVGLFSRGPERVLLMGLTGSKRSTRAETRK
eukprot:332761-Rhodomonas_salina.1